MFKQSPKDPRPNDPKPNNTQDPTKTQRPNNKDPKNFWVQKFVTNLKLLKKIFLKRFSLIFWTQKFFGSQKF